MLNPSLAKKKKKTFKSHLSKENTEDNIKLHIHAHGCHKINKHVMSQVAVLLRKSGKVNRLYCRRLKNELDILDGLCFLGSPTWACTFR